MIGRRGFITGMVSLVAAPAIVRVASIMPVKVMRPIVIGMDFGTFPAVSLNRFGAITMTSWLDTLAWLQKQPPESCPEHLTFEGMLDIARANGILVQSTA